MISIVLVISFVRR